ENHQWKTLDLGTEPEQVRILVCSNHVASRQLWKQHHIGKQLGCLDALVPTAARCLVSDDGQSHVHASQLSKPFEHSIVSFTGIVIRNRDDQMWSLDAVSIAETFRWSEKLILICSIANDDGIQKSVALAEDCIPIGRGQMDYLVVAIQNSGKALVV